MGREGENDISGGRERRARTYKDDSKKKGLKVSLKPYS